MSVVAGHQVNHLPYGGYFAKMNSVDVFVLVDNTQYVKKEFHNRNRILSMNGSSLWLSVPVLTSGRFHQKINEVEINNTTGWVKQHLKTIRVSYGKAPYFVDIFPRLESIYQQNWTYLADLNIAIIKLFREQLEISTPVQIASELGASGKASHLIADICQRTASSTYLHGKHSRDYVDFGVLESHSIKSLIQSFECREYPQRGSVFCPNLSVIDLLFNCGPDSLDILMSGHHVSEFESTGA